ncbi:MAG: TetR/AcrR family transcriptional regulator [Peptostreptococcaceae bacterium]|nr:TetR/AcrR family transcriptional regulator [Peptostreptococcaceae bacterium]
MKGIKKRKNRKNEILDSVEELFLEKGMDETSTEEILKRAGIARGTLYHHFRSKNEIMDALIERMTDRLVERSAAVAQDRSIPVIDRFFAAIRALHVGEEGSAMLNYLNEPQNAMMHQKTQHALFLKVPPILAGILEEGMLEGLFDSPYPLEVVEMTGAYLQLVLDSDYLSFEGEVIEQKLLALAYNLERMLFAEPGSFQRSVRTMTGG